MTLGLIVCSNFLNAQNELIFRNPNLPFSDNGIRAITQDYKGFMWFGTQSGLNCFDGVNMKIYNKTSNDTNSLISNSILSLFESSKNELWVGTTNGVCRYNRNADNFTRFLLNKEDPTDLNSNYIVSILEDDDGDIWIATRGGVYIYSYLENLIKAFDEYSEKANSNYQSKTILIAKDKFGRIVGITPKSTLIVFNKRDGNIKEFFFDNGNKSKRLEFESVEISNGETEFLWLSTNDKGLIQITELKGGSVFFKQHKHNALNKNSISMNSAFAICNYNESSILIGTENGGLNLYNFIENKFTRYIADDDPENGISGNSIWSIHKDKRDNIWIGIFNHGVNLINSIPPKFKTKSYSVLNNEGITKESITDFYEDAKENIWITSDGGGLDYWDRKNDVFKHFLHDDRNNKTLSSDAALCICKPVANELWIGCYNGGINILNNEGKAIGLLNTKHGLSSNNVFSLAQRQNGLVYIGTYGGGVDVCNPITKEIEPLIQDLKRRNETIYQIVNVLFVDKDDNLWVGYEDGGVDKYIFDSNGEYNLVHYQNDPDNSQSIGDNSILVINQDSRGDIWFGTRDGINVYNEAKNSFKSYRISDGLPSNTVVGVIEDNYGKIWISTLNGLSAFNVEDTSFTNYTISDGLQSLKYTNRNAIYKNKKGELFFGASNGFTYVNPTDIQYDRTFPAVYFVDFKLFNKPVEIGTNYSPLPKQITELNEISLKQNQSVFTIGYVAVNYMAPEKIKYAYRLVGLEEEWNYVGKKREANYTNLDQGEYLFQVKSTNIEGDWNTEIRTMKIIILPAWYETIMFRIIMIVLLVLFIYLIFLNRVRGIKIKQKELEEKVHERTKALNKSNIKLEEKTNELSDHKNNLEQQVKKRTFELEVAKEKAEESDRLKSAFLSNMSHEIRTPMNAIVGFSQLLYDPNLDEETKATYLSQISSSTSGLLYLIEDIIDLSKIEANQIVIETNKFDLVALFNEVYKDALIINENKELELVLNLNGLKTIIIESDKHRIKQVLLNLFNNACKFTNKGSVELGLVLKGDLISCYVKDTGIGISKENQQMIFDRFRKFADDESKLFRGAGLGLSISKRISELLGAELKVRSELGSGTEFILILPENIQR